MDVRTIAPHIQDPVDISVDTAICQVFLVIEWPLDALLFSRSALEYAERHLAKACVLLAFCRPDLEKYVRQAQSRLAAAREAHETEVLRQMVAHDWRARNHGRTGRVRARGAIRALRCLREVAA